MKLLIIALDFNANAINNDDVYEAIKAQGVWWHYMKSTWLVHTSKSVQQVADGISPAMKSKGRMLIAELHRPYQGLLNEDAWKWIRERVS